MGVADVSRDLHILANGRQRAEYGCTTTWENAAGETRTFTKSGAPRAALRTQAEWAVAWDDTAKLVAYSTPDTVFADVSGLRSSGELVRGGRFWRPTVRPEAGVLSAIGLVRLCHPRLRGYRAAT